MATVIPKQPKKERDQITIRLDRDVLETLEHYCRYLESSRDYVINQCLTFIFRKDKAFTMWLNGQGFASLRHSCRNTSDSHESEGQEWGGFRDAFPSVNAI
jgi:hypothetical protein